jgi:hypothetical protein
MRQLMNEEVTRYKTTEKKPLEDPNPAVSDANAENARLRECYESQVPWKKWGPYLSERQW